MSKKVIFYHQLSKMQIKIDSQSLKSFKVFQISLLMFQLVFTGGGGCVFWKIYKLENPAPMFSKTLFLDITTCFLWKIF